MSWIHSSEQLIQEIAGDDMVDQACYLVPFAWVREHEPRLRGGSCAAWTSPLADLLLHKWLSNNNRWHGRGFATIIHGDQLQTVQAFAGAVLHEFGHYLTFDVPQEVSELDHTSERVLSWVPLSWAELSPVAVDPRPLPRWHEHGADFVRACCHLAHRVESVLGSVRPHHIRFVRAYYLGFSEGNFMEALSSELDRGGSIRSILRTNAPDEFTELWNYAVESKERKSDDTDPSTIPEKKFLL